MEKKVQAVNVVWDLLEYLYMLGFTTAKEEVGQIAEDVKPFLPDDYDDAKEKLTDEERKVADMSIFRKFDNKDFTDRVREYAELGNANEILRVVETDGNRVYNTGGIEGARKSGAKYKTWQTMSDDRVRDTHDPLHGVKVGIDDKFVTWDGDEAKQPGDFTDPSNNVNCRCWLEFSK